MANGSDADVLDRMFACEPVGTLFLPHGGTLPARKRWLGFTARPKGKLVVNEGAKKAVREQGKSLLPVGVVEVQGTFNKGDVLTLCDVAGAEFAGGLTNYSSEDATEILGLRSDKIGAVLGRFRTRRSCIATIFW